jgi:hypothetical protein
MKASSLTEPQADQVEFHVWPWRQAGAHDDGAAVIVAPVGHAKAGFLSYDGADTLAALVRKRCQNQLTRFW